MKRSSIRLWDSQWEEGGVTLPLIVGDRGA